MTVKEVALLNHSSQRRKGAMLYENEDVLDAGEQAMQNGPGQDTRYVKTHQQEVALIKVPFGLAGARNGAELGPDELITAGLKREIASLGFLLNREVRVDCPTQSATPLGRKTVKYLNEVQQVSEQVCQEIRSALEEGLFRLYSGRS